MFQLCQKSSILYSQVNLCESAVDNIEENLRGVDGANDEVKGAMPQSLQQAERRGVVGCQYYLCLRVLLLDLL